MEIYPERRWTSGMLLLLQKFRAPEIFLVLSPAYSDSRIKPNIQLPTHSSTRLFNYRLFLGLPTLATDIDKLMS